MKMKLLDYAILSLVAGSSMAIASEVAADAAQDAIKKDACVQAECSDDGVLLFRVRSQSYDEPVTAGTSVQSGSVALAPDRRVTLGL